MGKPKPAVTTTQGTQEQKYDQKSTQDQTSTSTGQVGGVQMGEEKGRTTTTGERVGESETERKQRQEQESRTKQQGTVTGTGTSRDTTTGTSRDTTTGLTKQQQENINRTSGGTENRFGWAERPDTEDTRLFRKSIQDFEGVQDPTISFNAANQREQVMRMAQNPLGPYTTPESRQAITANALSQIGQQEGQGYLQDAFNRSQQKLQAIGMQGQLAQMTQPLRELLGTQQSQEQIGTQTGTTQQDQTRLGEQAQTRLGEQANQQTTDMDTVTNAISQLTGTDSTRSKELTSQVSDFMKENFGMNFGYSESEDESHGVSTGTGTSSGTNTGTSTYTPPAPSMASQLLGGAASAAAII